MPKTVRVCPRCGEQNGKFANWCRVPSCGENLGEIPETVVDDEPPPSGARASADMPKAKAPGSAAGPATEVAPGDKGMLEVMELPGRLIRVCGAGILGRGAGVAHVGSGGVVRPRPVARALRHPALDFGDARERHAGGRAALALHHQDRKSTRLN